MLSTRLPDELILLIFANVVFDSTGKSPEDIVKGLAITTAVCKLWRSLAINDPTLWALIHVGSSEITPQAHRISALRFDRVATFLRRSQSAPLVLVINRPEAPRGLPAYEFSDMEKEWISMYDLLRPHMNRCRNLKVTNNAREPSTTRELLGLLQTPEFPLLEEFSFIDRRVVMSEYDRSAFKHSWRMGASTTPLKSFQFTSWVSHLPTSLDVAWPALETLDLSLEESCWPEISQTLARLTSLQTLHINIIRMDLSGSRVSPSSPTRIVLHELRHLTTNYLPIWYYIQTPSLSSINLKDLDPYNPWNEEFSRECGPKSPQLFTELAACVREVQFQDSFLELQLTIPFLRELKSVTKLVFRDCAALHDVISYLSANIHGSTPQPISLLSSEEMDVDGAALSLWGWRERGEEFLPALSSVTFVNQILACGLTDTRGLADRLTKMGIRVSWHVDDFAEQ
ncbi:hypothetical protein DL93DRAFT_2087727 [Clavulina sp. PMI_390]|nr:hypothetical protein DL93DRAFT_2087727 [Clavulina sp. PMI_390]